MSAPASQTLMQLCGVLAGAEWSHEAIAGAEPRTMLPLLDQHGLTALMTCLPERVARVLPAQIGAEAARCRLIQTAKNMLALRQLHGIATAFAERGIPILALKGVAAMGVLYPAVGCRRLGDLDLLVAVPRAADVRPLMTALGYTSVPTSTSTQDEWIQSTRTHMNPFVKQGEFPVEIHLSLGIPGGAADLATADIWRESVGRDDLGPGVRALCPGHFILHAAIHYLKHQRLGFAPLHWLLEINVAVRHWRDAVDWDAFWHTAARWNVKEDTRTVLTTLSSHWHLRLQGRVRDAAAPLTIDNLVRPLPSGRAPISLASMMARLRLTGDLPDFTSRARYMFRLVFPTEAHLRHRYQHAGGRLPAMYLRHVSTQVQRLALGVMDRQRLRNG